MMLRNIASMLPFVQIGDQIGLFRHTSIILVFIQKILFECLVSDYFFLIPVM
jgi:hypothetical protein